MTKDNINKADKPFCVVHGIGLVCQTPNDWYDFIRNKSPTEAVCSSNGFDFNAFNICMNPDIPVSIELDTNHNVEISTAQSPNGRWSYGMSCHTGASGYGHGASYIADPEQGFASERAAIIAAIDASRKRVECSNDTSSKARLLLKALAEEREKYSLVQMSLFDFM